MAKIFVKPEYLFIIYSALVSWEKGETAIIFDFEKLLKF